MRLHELAPPPGARHKRKRVGRGEGSGLGKTSGRGHKGQKARSGGGTPPGFEGGQMPLQRRLPKRGFTNIFKKEHLLVTVGALAETFIDGAEVGLPDLFLAGLVSRMDKRIKLLSDGDVGVKLKVSVHAASKAAKAKIEAAGGEVVLVEFKKGDEPLNSMVLQALDELAQEFGGEDEPEDAPPQS